MAIRISGLSSGLDTEAIVQQLVSAYSVKKDKYVKAQTKLSWKQDAWKALNTKVKKLYTNITSLKYSGAYNSKAATVSNSTKASVKASGSAVNGSYSLSIEQMAKSGYLTGGTIKSGSNGGTKLSDLLGDEAIANGRISVTSAGKTTEIEVTGDTTISDFVGKLNEAGVKASYDSNYQRIYVAAKDTGIQNDFSLTGIDADGTKALKALGLNVKSNANTSAYQAWAEYNGQDLQSILDQISAAKATIEDSTNTIAQERAKISNLSANRQYAANYKTMKDATSGLTQAERLDLNDLASMSASDKKKTYALDENGNLMRDDDGKLVVADESTPEDRRMTGQAMLDQVADKAGLVAKREGEDDTRTTIAEYAKAQKAVEKYEAAIYDDTLTPEEREAMEAVRDNAHNAYDAGTMDAHLEQYDADIADHKAVVSEHENTIKENQAILDKYALLNTGEDAAALQARIDYAVQSLNNTDASQYSEGATRVNAQDSVIWLNNARYTSNSNTYSINGLQIEALGETGRPGEPGSEELNVTVKTDVDGIYNKIKDFLKEYNELINEMTSLYNADSAKGYDPLTAEEKDALTDTEIEEWEKKIKGSLLRRDDTLSGLMNSMTRAMSKSYEINGKKYSLASFGIQTLGVLNAQMNEESAYHIYGDPDDAAVADKSDRLRKMIEEDPDAVTQFMMKLTSGLYDEIDAKMKSSSLSSAFTVYNDKQMATEYSNYNTTIKKWEEKLQAMEDSYYKKFAAMETALAKLQNSTSSLTNLFG